MSASVTIFTRRLRLKVSIHSGILCGSSAGPPLCTLGTKPSCLQGSSQLLMVVFPVATARGGHWGESPGVRFHFAGDVRVLRIDM